MIIPLKLLHQTAVVLTLFAFICFLPAAAPSADAKEKPPVAVHIEGIRGDLLENVRAHLSLERPPPFLSEEGVRRLYQNEFDPGFLVRLEGRLGGKRRGGKLSRADLQECSHPWQMWSGLLVAPVAPWINTLQARYKINRLPTLQGESGDETGMDLIYTKEYH